MQTIQTQKICRICNETKPISDYQKMSINPNTGRLNYSSYCLPCQRAKCYQYRKPYVPKPREQWGKSTGRPKKQFSTEQQIEIIAFLKAGKSIHYIGQHFHTTDEIIKREIDANGLRELATNPASEPASEPAT